MCALWVGECGRGVRSLYSGLCGSRQATAVALTLLAVLVGSKHDDVTSSSTTYYFLGRDVPDSWPAFLTRDAASLSPLERCQPGLTIELDMSRTFGAEMVSKEKTSHPCRESLRCIFPPPGKGAIHSFAGHASHEACSIARLV